MNNFIPDGALIDTRPIEEKSLDHLHTAGLVTPNWVEKTSCKRFTQRNQDGSFSCVMQSCAKAIEVLTGKVISATPYFWRKNYPNGGMWLQDAGDIMRNRYSCLETSSPSQNQSEVQMNTIKQLTTNIGCTEYKQIVNPNNIEQIAEAIEAYGQCVILSSSNSDEWQRVPKYLGTPTTFNHAICAVDYGLFSGLKAIFCEDSAGQWSSPDGLRIITQDYLSKRAFGAMYFLGAKDVSVPQDQKFVFNIDMAYGQTSNDIKELQKRLGVIPTGYYGNLTASAVVKYQLSHGIKLTFLQRYFTKYSVVGPNTRKSLNK
jgi:hypothetical protein